MRPFHHNSNMARGGESSGPFLSEHLRVLDLELELLKRKRDMIEKQPSLLNQTQMFNSFSYDQPQSQMEQKYDDGLRFNSNRDYSSSSRDFSSSARDYSHLYDEPQQSRDRFPRQSAKKRLGEYVWSDPPKRAFGGSANKYGSGQTNKFGSGPTNKFSSGPPNKFASGSAKKFGSGPSSKQSKYHPPSERGFSRNQPGKVKPSERFVAPQKPVKPKPTDFKPSKVVKAKTALANKASTFVPKKIVADSVPVPDPGATPILEADQAPTPQMAGRLELALGNILKVVKDKYGKDPLYKASFLELASGRVMKQEIRQRIRKVMVGKPVGHVVDIIKRYREVYPDSTDMEIVEVGMQKKDLHKPRSEFKLVTDPTLNPYIFFKRNFSQLLSFSLNRLFGKIVTINKEEALKMEMLEEKMNTSTSEEVTAQTEAGKTEGTEAYDPEVPTEDSKVSVEPEDQNITEKTNEEDTSEKSKDGANLNEESKEDATEKTNTDNSTGKPDENKGVDISHQNIKYPVAAVRAQYEKMMNEMMPKKLSLWLPKLKVQIMQALMTDLDFKKARKQIVEETESRLNKEQKAEPSTPGAKNADSKKPKLKYYVKIQGRPTLPKKPLMQPFLDQFNPKVVKKIKSLRNLLFVGFENKADFDRIVAANGTVIGTDTIIVKISQWVTTEALNAPAEPTSTPNTSAISEGDVSMSEGDVSKTNADLNDATELNTSLDNQIDELLTSIRNEEEAGNNENQDSGNENNTVDQNAGPENVEEADDVAENAGTEEPVENEAANNENVTEEVQESTENNEIEAKDEDSTENNEEINAEAKDEESTENNEDINAEAKETTENNEEIDAEAKDKVEELKSEANETGRATPTRTSSRLAASTPTTPSTIRTRRASRLAQN